MNGDALKKVRSGEPLAIPARAYNAFVDAALAHREAASSLRSRAPHGRASRPDHAATILVRNDSGADIPRFGILGLDSPVIGPDDNLASFQNQPAFSGSTPAAGTHEGRFAVVQQPLASGAIGPAVVDGLSVARINVADASHTYADVADGDATQLLSSAAGSARILWIASGTGTQWALVSLGHTPAGGAGGGVRQMIITAIHDDYLACRDWDGQAEGETDVEVARPWELQRTPWDGESHTIDGVIYSYTYADAESRVKSADGQDEDQVIVPPYFVGAVIQAAALISGHAASHGDDPVTLVRLIDTNNAARAWAQVDQEAQP